MIIIGLISGTSADGIDAALCEISGEPPRIQARVLAAMTQPYPAEVRQQVLDTCVPGMSQIDAICQLNYELAEHFAAIVLTLIDRGGMKAADIDLIGSHGQTVWHNILPDGTANATLQLTEAAVLAERTGITTISNFRARDVAAGGQGAPLVSYLDWLLLRHPEHWRAVQNIGGIGNVTFLPPLSDATSSPMSFDTGPGNVLMDAAMTQLTHGSQTYDQDGRMAQSGQADRAWLESLLQHAYYRRQPPKTTGRELFGTEMALQLIEEGQRRGRTSQDIIATLTALTAHSIADAYRRFAPAPMGEVIVAGGGSNNPALLAMLRELVKPAPVLTHEDIGLSSDHKEALLFALLAYETWHARPGNLPALTGARHPVVMGQITPGDNYVGLLKITWC
ncbi:MAG: anhydro-N-acetylmuramic acid kinase [Anaerolineae bacterium]|nr:anhydro-N-acetylmuramic acid kinase [Anaerolineae bacterium]